MPATTRHRHQRKARRSYQRKTRRSRCVKQVGGAFSITSYPKWESHMAPKFLHRVFFFVDSEDEQPTSENEQPTSDTIVDSEMFDYIASNWSSLSQDFCPLEFEGANKVPLILGRPSGERLSKYDGVLALCVSPSGNIEGMAMFDMEDNDDIICPGREGTLPEETRTTIERILEKAIEDYKENEEEDESEEEDEEDEDD